MSGFRVSQLGSCVLGTHKHHDLEGPINDECAGAYVHVCKDEIHGAARGSPVTPPRPVPLHHVACVPSQGLRRRGVSAHLAMPAMLGGVQ